MDINNLTLGNILALASVITSLYAIYKIVKEIRKPRQDKDKKFSDDLEKHQQILDSHGETLKEHSVKLDKIDGTLDIISEEIKESSEYTKGSDELIKTALCSIQREKLLSTLNKYLDRGFASLEEKEAMTLMYESYKALGGNGFINTVYEQAMKLPLHLVNGE